MQRSLRAASVAVIVALAAASGASALTLLVSSTSAFAGDSIAGHGTGDPLSASISDANGTQTAAAVASVTTGHIGASSTNGAGADALVSIVLNVSDVQAGDYILVQTTLNGSFAALPGNAGNAYFRTKSDNDPYQTGGIFCGSFNVTNYGTACRSQTVPGAPITNDTTILVTLDSTALANVSTLELQWELQVGSSAGGFASFLNSEDFTVSVPQGTTINGNPGGVVFQVVPEPTAASLLPAGGVAWFVARRKRRLR